MPLGFEAECELPKPLEWILWASQVKTIQRRLAATKLARRPHHRPAWHQRELAVEEQSSVTSRIPWERPQCGRCIRLAPPMSLELCIGLSAEQGTGRQDSGRACWTPEKHRRPGPRPAPQVIELGTTWQWFGDILARSTSGRFLPRESNCLEADLSQIRRGQAELMHAFSELRDARDGVRPSRVPRFYSIMYVWSSCRVARSCTD